MVHATWPALPWNLPAAQLVHEPASLSEWTPAVEPVNVDGKGTAYAYVLDYHTDLGTPVLARLLQDGVTARVAKRPIVSGGTT